MAQEAMIALTWPSLQADTAPGDLQELISLYLEAPVTENEDNLMDALRATFASRAELIGMKGEMLEKLQGWLDDFGKDFRGALTHIKEGNGAPGLYPLQDQISTLQHEIRPLKEARSNWSRLKWAVTTGVLTFVAGMALQWAMANKVVAPVAQKADTDQAEVAGLRKTVEDLNVRFTEFVKNQTPTPTTPRPRGRGRAQTVKHPEPPIGQLKDGDIVDSKIPMINEMRRP